MSLEKSLFDVADFGTTISENVNWFENNYEELRNSYKGEWVAIFNKVVFAHSKKYVNVLKLISEMRIDTKNVYVQFLEREKKIQISQEAYFSLFVGI